MLKISVSAVHNASYLIAKKLGVTAKGPFAAHLQRDLGVNQRNLVRSTRPRSPMCYCRLLQIPLHRSGSYSTTESVNSEFTDHCRYHRSGRIWQRNPVRIQHRPLGRSAYSWPTWCVKSSIYSVEPHKIFPCVFKSYARTCRQGSCV